MPEFLEIRCLSETEVVQIEDEIRGRIAERKALGRLTDRDVEEIIEMRLRPLPDLQDVQSVYENFLFPHDPLSWGESVSAGRSSGR